MRRIRLVLALLFAGLAVPVALLVGRALEGQASEARLRQQTVAERAFDEMERELSSFLAEEEARPFADYRFYTSEPEAGLPPVRSPLSSPPARPFVLGYFQIDPDGSVHVPQRPRDPERARAQGDWPPEPPVERAIARTEALLREHWPAGEAGGRLDALDQAPGSTVLLPKRSPAAPAKAEVLEESPSAYDALQGLNRGLAGREQRQRKVAEAPYAVVLEEQARAPEGELSRARALEADAFFDAPRAPAEAAPAQRRVRMVLDPMVGRRLDGDVLALYRSVTVAERGYRQGLLVDLAALGRWLDDRVLRPGPLGSVAAASFVSAGQTEAGGEAVGDAYRHRFAEPFDALAVRLELERLPGIGPPLPVYALALLVLATGGLGLLAVDRMVSVVVQFAERRTNFVASVSHELKTPLTAIRMYAEMLRDDLVPSESKRREYYATLCDESERLSRLIHNVLEFSSLERGTREMQVGIGAVGPVLAEALETLEPHARRQGFALRLEVEPELPPVRMDRDAVVQMLFNLLDNAFKYAAGAERREVLVQARLDQGRVVVAVRDFGPGVPTRHLRRVFEPFYRGEDELTRSAKGSGIGLALVRELAQRMGAAVRGSNVEGGGFRVEIRLEPGAA